MDGLMICLADEYIVAGECGSYHRSATQYCSVALAVDTETEYPIQRPLDWLAAD